MYVLSKRKKQVWMHSDILNNVSTKMAHPLLEQVGFNPCVKSAGLKKITAATIKIARCM